LLRFCRQDEGALAVSVLYSPDRAACGRELELREPLVVGREPGEAGLAIADPLLSRAHLVIEPDPATAGGAWLRDEGSLNGTSLRGLRVGRELLRPGDVLRAGDTVLLFGRRQHRPPQGAPQPGDLLAGGSPELCRARAQLRKVAPTDLTVLLEGETGTGKELAARTLHARSGRQGPFVPINCTAIPEALLESELFGHLKGAYTGASGCGQGLIRAADGGTLLLDEVGDLSPGAQAKLLRVLETREVRPVGSTAALAVDVRFVAATNQDLDEAVRVGRFRPDLLARLLAWRLRLPPLRTRTLDLLPICRATLASMAPPDVTWSMDADYFEALTLYPWPYNVRELVAVLGRARVELPQGGTLRFEHLPDQLRTPPARHPSPSPQSAEAQPVPLPPPRPGEAPTARQLESLLHGHSGNVSRIAQQLDCDRGQVYRWLRRHGLRPEWFRPEPAGASLS